MNRWSRRQFLQSGLSLVSAAALAGCGLRLPQVQPQERIPRIGYLGLTQGSMVTAFQQGLRELGYVEGQNLLVEYRFTDGYNNRLPGQVQELLGLNVELLVVSTDAALAEATKATQTLPIVANADLVGLGLAASLARPGGNVTGPTNLSTLLTAKQVELLKETVPTATRLAMISNPRNPETAARLVEAQRAAQILRMEAIPPLEATDPPQVGPALASLSGLQAEALLPLQDPLLQLHREQIAQAALQQRLPSIYPYRNYAEAGGLMAYGPNQEAIRRRMAVYVDKILKGARPATLPIEQPTTFDFVVNKRAAEALGLWPLPESIQLQVTEVIP